MPKKHADTNVSKVNYVDEKNPNIGGNKYFGESNNSGEKKRNFKAFSGSNAAKTRPLSRVITAGKRVI